MCVIIKILVTFICLHYCWGFKTGANGGFQHPNRIPNFLNNQETERRDFESELDQLAWMKLPQNQSNLDSFEEAIHLNKLYPQPRILSKRSTKFFETSSPKQNKFRRLLPVSTHQRMALPDFGSHLLPLRLTNHASFWKNDLEEPGTGQSGPTSPPQRSRTPNITWGRAQKHTASFDDPNLINVTARDGEQARLPCTVLHLGQAEVSWIRKRDLHILAVGRATYTNDQRFKVLHGDGSLDWTLIIGPVTQRDGGVYECQVSTKPKISRPVNLIVSVEKAEIQGPAEIFIRNGSTISLTCIVKSKSEDLGSVAWMKKGEILDYDSPRGGVSLEVEKTPTRATTKLFITKARKADSGVYICSPQFAQPASVTVHVVNGEESAAVQTSGSSVAGPLSTFLITACYSFIYSMFNSLYQLYTSNPSECCFVIIFFLFLNFFNVFSSVLIFSFFFSFFIIHLIQVLYKSNFGNDIKSLIYGTPPHLQICSSKDRISASRLYSFKWSNLSIYCR